MEESKKFEFVICTCPESEERRHAHIYNNVKRENSFHIYEFADGIKFLDSIPEGEITGENMACIISEMLDLFIYMPGRSSVIID